MDTLREFTKVTCIWRFGEFVMKVTGSARAIRWQLN
jgi:hypothetical protein